MFTGQVPEALFPKAFLVCRDGRPQGATELGRGPGLKPEATFVHPWRGEEEVNPQAFKTVLVCSLYVCRGPAGVKVPRTSARGT